MTKRASLTLKGLAIIFMLLTHFLDYQQPTNLISPPLANSNLDHFIGYAAGICVAIFAFVNGYGLTLSLSKMSGAKSKAIYLAKKAIVFLLEYWVIVFSIFLPFYLASGGAFALNELWRTLIGYNGIHAFAWYVWFYLIVLVVLPFGQFLFPKKAPWWVGLIIAYVPLTLIIVVLSVTDKTDQLDYLRGNLCHAISVMGGVAFAKYHLFEKIKALLAKAKLDRWWFYLIFALIGLALLGYFHKGIIAPFALLPLLFLWTSLFDDHLPPKPVLWAFGWLGKLSMPIWFIHYLFFAGYVNQFIPLFDFVSSARIGIFIALFALLICVPLALVYYFVFAGAKRLVVLAIQKRNARSDQSI